MARWKLFLDDERDPSFVKWVNTPDREEVVVCRNYDDFVATITGRGMPFMISFDHDLGDFDVEWKSGYDCAKWLVDYLLDNPELWNGCRFRVHSMNPVGAKNIQQLLYNFVQHMDSGTAH